MNHAEVLLPTLVAVLVGALVAAAATYVRRLMVEARARDADLDALGGLTRLATIAPNLEVGLAAAEPFILHLAAASSLHLRWSSDDAPEWAPIPGRIVVPLGSSGSGPVSLVLDGVARPGAVDMLVAVVRVLCERDRCAAEVEQARRSELLAKVADRNSLARLLELESTVTPRTIVLLSLDQTGALDDQDLEVVHFAATIAEQVRPTDTIVRAGDAELCLGLATDAVRATQVVDRIRAAWRTADPGSTFSAGVAAQDGSPDDDPLARAQTALQRAQAEGGDRTVLACPLAIQRVA